MIYLHFIYTMKSAFSVTFKLLQWILIKLFQTVSLAYGRRLPVSLKPGLQVFLLLTLYGARAAHSSGCEYRSPTDLVFIPLVYDWQPIKTILD